MFITKHPLVGRSASLGRHAGALKFPHWIVPTSFLGSNLITAKSAT